MKGGVMDSQRLQAASSKWVPLTNGNVYASVFGGDIYMQTGGTGNFVALGQTSRQWYGMTTLNGNVYACVNGGDIYMQTGGVGAFDPARTDDAELARNDHAERQRLRLRQRRRHLHADGRDGYLRRARADGAGLARHDHAERQRLRLRQWRRHLHADGRAG